MNRIILQLSLATLIASAMTSTQAQTSLSKEESNALASEAFKLIQAMESGDIEHFVKSTHPIIYQKLIGSVEEHRQSLKATFDLLEEEGVAYEDYEIGDNSPVYRAGEEEFTFLRTIVVMRVESRKERVRINGLLIAIRPASGGEWKFLDGAFFKDQPDLLFEFFPALPRTAVMPKQSYDELEYEP